jgi:hypothetical protein
LGQEVGVHVDRAVVIHGGELCVRVAWVGESGGKREGKGMGTGSDGRV